MIESFFFGTIREGVKALTLPLALNRRYKKGGTWGSKAYDLLEGGV